MKAQSAGTQMQAHEFIELESQHEAHNYRPLDVVIDRAEGVWVYGVEGKRYLDCLAAYSAVKQTLCKSRIAAEAPGLKKSATSLCWPEIVAESQGGNQARGEIRVFRVRKWL